MPLFKRKLEQPLLRFPVRKTGVCPLAQKWAWGTGLSENWDGRASHADPVQVCEVLDLVPVEKGKGIGCRQQARKQYLVRQTLIQEKLHLEKELAELQGRLSMLQCQNFILGIRLEPIKGSLRKLQSSAPRKGKVNAKKVHAVIATAKADWDLDTWVGDIWDETDDEPDWDDLDEEARKYHPPPLQAKPLARRHQKVAPDGRAETYLIQEDFTLQEVQDILFKFTQKPNEPLLERMVRIADMGAGGIRIDHQDAGKFVTVSTSPTVQTAFRDHQNSDHADAHVPATSIERLYNQKADQLTKINANTTAEDHSKCAQWVHEHTGHAGAKTMYRWAQQRGIYLPLDICRTVTIQCPVCNQDRLQQVPRIVTGELARGKQAAQIWQIDYIGPLPISKGCAYICTIVNTYSGVLIGCSYKRATQLNILKTLDYIILYYGVPMQIQSDNGSHFKGKVINDYCAHHNIKWIYHIPYYPQAAGLIERMNGLLKEKLRKFTNPMYSGWKSFLLPALQQLNNRPLGNGQTPLQRMICSNQDIEVRAHQVQDTITILWWKFHPDAIQPWNATKLAAGYDWFNYTTIKLDSKTQNIIPTGIGLKIPPGYYGQLAARSSLAQRGMTILGGIIDADYYGEIKILCYNIGDEDIILPKGHRVAQLLIIPILQHATWEVQWFPPTSAHLGFGSTDAKPISGHVWVQSSPHKPMQKGEIVAQVTNNCVYVIIPPSDTPILVPTHHLFNRGISQLCQSQCPGGAGMAAPETKVCYQNLALLVASAQKEPEAVAPAPGTGSESVLGETHRALQGAMEKLQSNFITLLKENADLKEWRDMISEQEARARQEELQDYIKSSEGQRVVPKTQHQEKEVTKMTQEEEEIKVKLLELQEPVLQLVIDQEAQNPANEPTPGAQVPEELVLPISRVVKFCEVSLANSDSLEPALGRVQNNPTAQQM
ncbi:Golgin subfamily A member 2, partial [Plecturocebus cupreus]